MQNRKPRGREDGPTYVPPKKLVFGQTILCPYCKGKGRKNGRDCGSCKGIGVIDEK